jgi:16S rRNA (guanine966-N2)-methyltransferase
MRIIAGTHRGIALAAIGAGDPAARLRPTSDRVREAIFNLLLHGGHGDPVTGALVLDLFAGTGALGLEALSRGAAGAILVENGAAALAVLRRNIAILRAEAVTEVLRLDATRLGPRRGPACGLVFLDPPYGRDLGGAALAAAAAGGWIAPGAVAVWEEAAAQPAPPGWARRDARRYGDTWVTILDAAAPG